MLIGAHKTQRMASSLAFSEWYHKDGDEFLNHIVLVTWWIMGFICECWNQRAVKVLDACTFTKPAKKCKQMPSY
jgi:hypothetical protein